MTWMTLRISLSRDTRDAVNRPVVAAHGYRSVLLIAKRINFFAAAQVRE
jgi:hypothetical protein